MNLNIRIQILQPDKASHISFSAVFSYPNEKLCMRAAEDILPFLLTHGTGYLELNETNLKIDGVAIQKNALRERTKYFEKTGN